MRCGPLRTPGIGGKIPNRLKQKLQKFPNRVYLVGADSYWGRHFAKYWLESGAEVHACGSRAHLPAALREVRYTQTDYSHWECLARSYDWIMLCLDPAWKPDRYLAVMQSLSDAIEERSISAKICCLSSFLACESHSRRIPEPPRLRPRSEYGMNLAMAELYWNMRSIQMGGKLPLRVVRMGEIYGNDFEDEEDAVTPGVIHESIRLASNGKPVVMHGLGLGKRSVTHISDACRFSIQYLNLALAPKEIHVPGEAFSVADLLLAIARKFQVECTLAPAGEKSVFCDKFVGNQLLSGKSAQRLVAYELQYPFKAWLAAYAKVRRSLRAIG